MTPRKGETMPEVEFVDVHGRWVWRFKTSNGTVLAVSAVGYSDARGARRGFTNLLRAIRPMVAALGDQ